MTHSPGVRRAVPDMDEVEPSDVSPAGLGWLPFGSWEAEAPGVCGPPDPLDPPDPPCPLPSLDTLGWCDPRLNCSSLSDGFDEADCEARDNLLGDSLVALDVGMATASRLVLESPEELEWEEGRRRWDGTADRSVTLAGGGMLAGEGLMCTMVTPEGPTDSRESVLKVSDSREVLENLECSETDTSEAELMPRWWAWLPPGAAAAGVGAGGPGARRLGVTAAPAPLDWA